MLKCTEIAKKKLLSFAGVTAFCLAILWGPGHAGAQDELTDQQIRDAVDDQLAKDQAIPAWNLDVITSEGIVTLTGKVKSILAKERAEKIAATVKGVRGVVNAIDVEATARPDAEIKEAVQKALIRDPATEAWELQASVDSGKVTLTGEVDSWQEYQLAGKVAKGVKGVKALTNNVRVNYRAERGDAEIAEDIEGMLHWDAFVDDALIDVAVDKGKVTLTGVVGSLAEKMEAENDAWVAGVTSVDNKLNIEWWERNERLRKDKYVARTDAQIEAAVKDVLLYDPRVASYKVAVVSDRGHVTLRGNVDNLKAKRAATKSAETVVGVWSVDNKIKVRTQEVEGSALAVDIRNALLEDPYINLFDINVSASNGVVHLFGDVDSEFEKNLAEDIASRQQGVVRVRNHLTVNEPFLDIYNPYVDELSSYDYGYIPDGMTTTVKKSDWELKEDIEDEFFWSPFVDGDDITVQVEDGKATLTGTVDTWGERRAATENALEGGAVVVDNELKTTFGPNYYLP